MKKSFKLIATVLLLPIVVCSFAQKSMNIEGSPNFRTLSGIENKHGKKIKDGLIYRSGSFSNLTEGDKTKFGAMKISTIIDFRSDSEIHNDPDYIPFDQNIETKRAMIGSMNDKEMLGFMKIVMDPKFNDVTLDSLMISASEGFTNHIKDFKPFFEEVAKKESVVLFHCSAGKDRTGLASALFLHILDVSRDEIIKDYLKSNEALAKIDFSKYKTYGIPEDRMEKLMGVKPIYLETSWNNIIKKYGSIDAMMAIEFGINEKEKKKIQKKYLVK